METVTGKPDTITNSRKLQLGNMSFGLVAHRDGLKLDTLRILDKIGHRRVNFLSCIVVFDGAFAKQDVENRLIQFFDADNSEIGQAFYEQDPFTELVTDFSIYEVFGNKPVEIPYVAIHLTYDEQERLANIEYSQWMERNGNFGYMTHYTEYEYGTNNMYRIDYRSSFPGSKELDFQKASLGVLHNKKLVSTVDYEAVAQREDGKIEIIIPKKSQPRTLAWFDTFSVRFVDQRIKLVD